MSEVLEPMVVVGGQVTTFYADVNSAAVPKVVIPAREKFVVGETIKVMCGSVLVAEHEYRSGDHFPVHVALVKDALSQVVGAQKMYYEIHHLDQTVSTSTGIRSKFEVFDSQATVREAAET